MTSIHDILGLGGALSRVLPDYEPRPGQIAMAEAIARAIDGRRHGAFQADTGIGKGIAYITPAVLSGKRVVISTATLLLQSQLAESDAPLLQRSGLAFTTAVVKGRANYLCIRRAREFAKGPSFPSRQEAALWSRIKSWIPTTTTGDRAELDLPQRFDTWSELSSTRDNCSGKRCPDYDRCHVFQARQRAAEADVVITNHALYCSDLALRARTDLAILPEHDVVVFDEAHAVPEVAAEALTTEISSMRIAALARDAKCVDAELADAVGRAGGRFLRGIAFAVGNGKDAGDIKVALTEDVVSKLTAERRRLDEALGALQARGGETAEQAAELRADLETITSMRDPTRAYVAEARSRSIFIRALPADVGAELRRSGLYEGRTAIFTSATLAVNGSFEFFRRQVGLGPELPADEAIFDGPFRYAEQAAIVIPHTMPREPKDERFLPAAASVIRDLTAITGGRALVLCTSLRNMKILYEASKGLPYKVMIQSEAPKERLIAALKREPSILFASMGFWTGVDVVGPALSLVVIDCLPFAVPDDPVFAARVRACEAAGGRAFDDLQLPAAALTLRQGFGRLVRSRNDRGLVAVLDQRLLVKKYGSVLLNTLPPGLRLLRSVEEARRWWEGVPDPPLLDDTPAAGPATPAEAAVSPPLLE